MNWKVKDIVYYESWSSDGKVLLGKGLGVIKSIYEISMTVENYNNGIWDEVHFGKGSDYIFDIVRKATKLEKVLL